MLKPICSFFGCSHPPIARVFFADGGGMGRYCKGHLTILRARSLTTRIPKNQILREEKL